MRIAFITNFYPPIQTGSCHWAKAMAEAHTRAGDEVAIITVGQGDKTYRDAAETAYPVYRLPSTFTLPKLDFFLNFNQFHLMDNRRNRADVLAILREHRIEIVHQSNHLLDSIFTAVWAADRLGVPAVSTIHGVIAHAGNRFYNAAMQAIDRTVLKRTMLRFDAIFSLDKANQDYVDGTYGHPRSVMLPLTCVHEAWLDAVALASPGELSPGGEFRIASIGHVTENRNRCDLVQALPTLLKQGIKPRLIVVGKIMTDVAVKLAQELGVSEYVEFRGEMAHAEIFQLLATVQAEAHIFFMPALGFATIEAMGVGLPTICHGFDGLYGPNIPLKNGANIMFAAQQDHAAVTAALLKLATDPALRVAMGQKARVTVREHLTFERAVERYHHEFHALIGHPAVAA